MASFFSLNKHSILPSLITNHSQRIAKQLAPCSSLHIENEQAQTLVCCCYDFPTTYHLHYYVSCMKSLAECIRFISLPKSQYTRLTRMRAMWSGVWWRRRRRQPTTYEWMNKQNVSHTDHLYGKCKLSLEMVFVRLTILRLRFFCATIKASEHWAIARIVYFHSKVTETFSCVLCLVEVNSRLRKWFRYFSDFPLTWFVLCNWSWLKHRLHNSCL